MSPHAPVFVIECGSQLSYRTVYVFSYRLCFIPFKPLVATRDTLLEATPSIWYFSEIQLVY